jgi:magnesium transporter
MMQPHTRAYRKGEFVAEDFAVTGVSEHLADPDTIVWVDLCGPTIEQLHELADELGLHELAVEDALGPHQRPKLDHYSTHLFFSCHAVSVDRATGVLDTCEIDAFINDRWLITVRKENGFSMDRVVSRWDRSPDLAGCGVPYLLYGLLDVVTDDYFQTVSVFDEYYDDVARCASR